MEGTVQRVAACRLRRRPTISHACWPTGLPAGQAVPPASPGTHMTSSCRLPQLPLPLPFFLNSCLHAPWTGLLIEMREVARQGGHGATPRVRTMPIAIEAGSMQSVDGATAAHTRARCWLSHETEPTRIGCKVCQGRQQARTRRQHTTKNSHSRPAGAILAIQPQILGALHMVNVVAYMTAEAQGGSDAGGTAGGRREGRGPLRWASCGERRAGPGLQSGFAGLACFGTRSDLTPPAA